MTSPVPDDPDSTDDAEPLRTGPLTAGADQSLGGAATGGGHAPAPDAGDRPGRPKNLTSDELGYTRHGPVPWLSPGLLAGTAVRVVLAELFGAYLDKRELQSGLPAKLYEEGDGDLWFDYVADLGDGFDATYTIAYLLGQPELTVDGETLPRADVLVMGGDQVYPTASGRQYQDRFEGPYRSASPEVPPGRAEPSLYALPGNHDWYDGLTAFLRLFARAEASHVGAWHTRQQRSYFALRLPQRWWLIAIDVQFGAYLDEPQLTYFRTVAEQIQPGDRVILCPPKPDWVEGGHAPTAYDTIDYFVRKILTPRGADIRMMIAGDMHHYARYSSGDRELITCGGGGAYLYPTHRLPDTLTVPPARSRVRNASPKKIFDRKETFPSAATSRRFAWGIFGRLQRRNFGFVTMIGLVHLLLMLAYSNAMQRVDSGVTRSLVTIPLVVMIVVVLGATVAFAMPSNGEERGLKHWLLGSGHGLAHLALGYGGARLWLALPLHDWTFPLPLLGALVTYLPPAMLASSLLVGLYLLVASSADVNVNELFAAQGIVDAKSFLRMHIARDGTLTIYPIGIDRVGRKWRANPDAAPHEPWIEPASPIGYRLMDGPIRIG
ncbi:hypothetical protein GCM10009557_71470 [Virgisporangium ochraceum]|uniref:Metallophosphoesterase n=1 Tax=Virgisporangium ochraceum TaxID=65505 RepID=A0A8J4EGC5_9ACTN|nr:metallophosphoesterase [Virgisporangium ochraceum]GIJ74620.1 hypothetical protein Voc01_095370 [Virgisporangium ochraceum]